MLDNTDATPILLNASFAALTSVAVQASAPTINVGQTQTFNAIGTFSNGATRSLTIGPTQFWRTKTPMGVARFSLAAGVVGNRLYAIGGVDGVCVSSPCPFAPLATVEMYNPAVHGRSEGGVFSIRSIDPTVPTH